jgi:ubiquinone biosynthesis protein
MASVLSIPQTVRHVRRYAEIVSILGRHGLQDLVQELGLDRLVGRGITLVRGEDASQLEALPRMVRVRRAMEQLGPTFIKMGQVLSTRPDLIPPAWAKELAHLQDDCPVVDFVEIRERLKEAFGARLDEIFKDIETAPLAAGSIAQAHRAVLADGTHVVMKILRPGIESVTRTDMEILQDLATILEKRIENMGIKPTEVVREFARELAKEVDLTNEARATDRLRAMFDSDDRVVFPKVYWEASARTVLTIEYIEGVPLSDRERVDAMAPEERAAIVDAGADAVLKMCLEEGFFHADPHPGNLFGLSEGRIAFIDCGMTGQLDAKTAEQLADLVAAVVQGDADAVIDVVGVLADAPAELLEDRAFRADVRDFVSHFQSMPLDKLDMGRLLGEFFDRLRDHALTCPGDLVLLIKALTTIEGVAARVDPSFDMVGKATPYVERLVKRRYGPAAMSKRMKHAFAQYAELAEDMPREVRGLLRQVRRNKLAVNLEHRGLTHVTRTIEHASRNIAYSLIIAATTVASAILIHAERGTTNWVLTVMGAAGLAAAASLMVIMIATNRRIKDR